MVKYIPQIMKKLFSFLILVIAFLMTACGPAPTADECMRKALTSAKEAKWNRALDQAENAVTVKLNTNDPGLVIQKGILYGDLTGLVIENRKLETEGSAKAASAAFDTAAKDTEAGAGTAEEAEIEMPHKDVGFITVSVGDGIEDIFRGLGVDYVISGGQTMNPSTDDILNAVNKVNADTIYVLPNNKNIVMAARQAAELTTDKKVIVIPTTTIPQGITAVINFAQDISPEENRENMMAGIEMVIPPTFNVEASVDLKRVTVDTLSLSSIG